MIERVRRFGVDRAVIAGGGGLTLGRVGAARSGGVVAAFGTSRCRGRRRSARARQRRRSRHTMIGVALGGDRGRRWGRRENLANRGRRGLEATPGPARSSARSRPARRSPGSVATRTWAATAQGSRVIVPAGPPRGREREPGDRQADRSARPPHRARVPAAASRLRRVPAAGPLQRRTRRLQAARSAAS